MGHFYRSMKHKDNLIANKIRTKLWYVVFDVVDLDVIVNVDSNTRDKMNSKGRVLYTQVVNQVWNQINEKR